MQQDVAFLEQQCTIKTKGENVMFVNPELHGKKRQEQLDENVRKATREHEEAKKNSGSPRYHLKAGNVLESSSLTNKG
jgi:hypothetical protein